jgi:amino acid transporter
MFLTVISITAIYLGMALCVSLASPSFVLSADKSTLIVAGTTLQATCPAMTWFLAGPIWGKIFTACVVASIIGCSFTAVMALARVSYSMAETKLFPSQFAKLHPETKVPTYSLRFQFFCLIAIAVGANLLSRTGAFADAYTFLCETFGFMYAFVAMLYGICVVSLRYTDPSLPRAFRLGKQGNMLVWTLAAPTVAIWGYAAFGCVGWIEQATGALILLAGIPIYSYYQRQNRVPQ